MVQQVFLAVIEVYFLFSVSAHAANSHSVAAGATVVIDEHSVCQQVINGTTKSIMVPTKDSSEWLSFRTNPPASVTLASCDVCNSTPAPSIGDTCGGGAKYAGTYASASYMVVPGGCNDSTTPTCGGSDAVTKLWRGSTGTSVDIGTIANLATSGAADPNLGSANTADIVAHASISSDSAAHWCTNLDYGGYQDWYLPNKEELNFLYGNRTAIGGFTANSYNSSSEVSGTQIWLIHFGTGAINMGGKNSNVRVRCVRRYTPTS